MPPEVAQALEAMPGAVVTRATIVGSVARIIAVSETGTFQITLTGCEWDDQRCDKCSCDPGKVSLQVERL